MKWILGICTVALVFGLVAAMTMPAQTVTPDQATLKLFPPEANGVAVIDVAGLRNSPLFSELVAQRKPAGMQRFVDATGFQPDRDIDQVTVGKIGARDIAAIVRARYDRIRVEQYLEERKPASETYLGRALYNFDAKNGGSTEVMSVSFIDDLIVAGHNAAVKQVIDRLAAPARSALDNSDLIANIGQIEAGNQVWAVGEFTLDALPAAVKLPAPAMDIVKSFTGGAYQMRLDTGVHVKATGNFNNDETARSTAELLRGLVALARFQSTDNPQLTQVLDGVRIEYAGSSMTVRFDGEGELLKQLQPRRRRAAAE